MIEALGLNISFLIELLVWLALCPIILKGLIAPYVALQKKKEALVTGRNKNSQILQKKVTDLQLKYDQMAKQLQTTFQTKYQKQSLPLKKQILEEGTRKRKLIKEKATQQLKTLDQQIDQTKKTLSSKTQTLTSQILLCLTKEKT